MTKDDLNHILRRYTSEDSSFHSHVNRLFDILTAIKSHNPGSRITAAVRATDSPSRFDEYLSAAGSRKGPVHALNHPGIEAYLGRWCDDETTAVIDVNGSVFYSGIRLPVDEMRYLRRHGIPCGIGFFMGYDIGEPDLQSVRALCSSDVFGGSVAMVTLGIHNAGRRPEISVFYAGDRIFNDNYREMRWAEADDDVSERKATVIPFYRGFRDRRGLPWDRDAEPQGREQLVLKRTGTDDSEQPLL